MSKSWVYDLQTQRYRDKKRGVFLSASRVAELTENYISQQQDILSGITDKLLSQKIDTKTWENQFAKTLKQMLVNSYVLGRGGMAQMSSRDLGLTSSIMREQYLYLRNFANEIMRGRLSDGQIRARANLYAEKIHSAYWQGRLEAHKAEGFVYEKDVLNANESCSSCVAIAARGWVPIGANPPIGIDRICKNNCRCTKEFSKEPQNNMLKQRNGWIGGMPVVKEAAVMDTQVAPNKYAMGTPTPEQLAKINQYARDGMPWVASDLVSIPMRASHNLLSHDNMAWAPASLADMALGMPGKPYLEDHEWDDLDATMGFIYDAELLHSSIAPGEFLEPPYGEINRQILAKDGFYQLVLHVAVEATHPIVQAIQNRRADGVSTGSLTKGIYICPLCEVEFPCGQHLPPTWYVMLLKRWGELTDEEVASIAPYIIRDGNYWSCEVSQVSIPNLQGTKILG